MKAKKINFDDIKTGDSVSFDKIISETDMTKFADISGDYNPLHLDEKYAKNTEFKGRVVYGMLMCAMVSRLVGMEMPGEKALLVKECLEFKKPARIGDKLKIKGIIMHKSQVSRLLEIKIEICKGEKLLTTGTAHVKVLK